MRIDFIDTVKWHLHNNPMNIWIIIQFANFVDEFYFRCGVRKLTTLNIDTYFAGRVNFHLYVDIRIFPRAYLDDSQAGCEVR